ncbi:hypothetical protein V3C99_007808 [Haemonchus contortus]|uniref:Uncharacterized protein n=1 Tax=Haemonchus contortus TaxID=6289 RepID=W6NGG8_HAECO
MGKGGYDRAQPYMSPLPRSSRASRGRSRTASKSEVSGISGFGSDPSGGCETVIQGKGGRGGKRGLAASASNKSKVNVLVTVLAVIFTQFIFCVIFAVIVLLHHARMIDWFPALTELTGEGYLREIKRGELNINIDKLE